MIRKLTPSAAYFLLFAAVLQVGCSGPSVWQTNYSAESPLPAIKLESRTPVYVRQIPFEPLAKVTAEIEEANTRIGKPLSDWPPEERTAAKVKLLAALEFSSDPATVEVLGHCDFRTTTKVDPDSGSQAIEPFARSIGATEAFWARHFLGKVERIEEKPQAGVPGESMWGRSYAEDRFGTPLPSASTTTWVTVKVVEDEYQYIAYFLRDLPRPEAR